MRKFLGSVLLATSAWLGGSGLCSAQTDFEWTGQLAPGQSIEIIGVNGSINASAARGGIVLIARTVNGSISAEGLQSDTEGTTVNGSVNVSTSGTARATTVNGSINATMDRAGWPNGGKFTTVNGAVTLRLPATVNADVRLSTVSGGIQSDFPVQMSNDPGPKHAEAVLGAGGQRLDVSTVNGGISLLRR